MQKVKIRNFFIGSGEPLVFFSGPCVIEDETLALESAWHIKEITESLGISYVYKSSYDKANRSSKDSFRGVGLEKGLKILQKVKEECDIPILTDVHTPEEARAAAEVCDVLQIPAFLCRQTDLIFAVAETGKVVKVKKGQFLAPWDMKNVVDKILSCGNNQIILTDRGTSFGYNNLVVDMRAIPIMQKLGFPVCFDGSHALQIPGSLGTSTGGLREYIPHLSKAAIAAGANCLYIEAHPDPQKAKSDKETVYPINQLKALLEEIVEIYQIIQKREASRA